MPKTYDALRPGYPAAAFDDLFAIAHLGPWSRVLEVGAGTGQASLELLRRSVRLTCIELSEKLAELLTRNLRAHGDPAPDVVVGDFEHHDVENGAFDMVFGATALHWIAPAALQRQADRALRRSGWVASLTNRHVAGDGTDFFAVVQQAYDTHTPGLASNFHLPTPEQAAHPEPVVEQLHGYGPAHLVSYPWQQTYTADEYVGVLGTYSTHLRLHPDARRRLLDAIYELIVDRYEGVVTKDYVCVLTMRQRES
ncbi:MAG: class I SAM-dependent methyltransferase [Egibacteraceae bacterium]